MKFLARNRALPGNAFDPAGPDRKRECERHCYSPPIERNSNAGGFLCDFSGCFGFVRHGVVLRSCFEFVCKCCDGASSALCFGKAAARGWLKKKKPAHRRCADDRALDSDLRLGRNSRRTRTSADRGATTRRATTPTKDAIIHAAQSTERAHACQPAGAVTSTLRRSLATPLWIDYSCGPVLSRGEG
jgi:hypothetical protein